jgi:hypothetical protein
MKSAYGTMYFVDDMKKAVGYYTKLLGVKPRYESAEWTEFPVGKHGLCLHAKERRGRYRPNGVLIVDAKGVKALFERLKRGKLDVSGLHEVHPGAWTFTLKDSSGNELSFHGAP